jgi:hypothetical protein
MPRFLTLATLVIGVLAGTESFAGYVKVKAKGSAPYGFFGPSSSDKTEAMADAKKQALKKYLSDLDSARQRLIDPHLPAIQAEIDQYVPEAEVLAERTNSDKGVVEVLAEVSIDESQFEKLIAAAMAEAAKKPGKGVDEYYICFVLVSRETKSVRTFEDRKTTRAEREESGSSQESGGLTKEGGYQGNFEVRRQTSATTGGSTLRQSEEVEYGKTTIQDSDAKIAEVLSKADIKIVKAEDLEIDTEAFRKEFSVGNDIFPSTRKAAIEKCRANDVRAFAVGTMDVGRQDTDPATGLQRVFVTVTVQVSDLSKKFPVTVASVGPAQYSGLGPDPQVAKNNALAQAQMKAAKDIADQIRAKAGR